MEDFDGDGRPDVLLGGFFPTDPGLFYRNLGDGRFEDRSAHSGIAAQAGMFRMKPADYDNDGDVDVIAVRSGWMGRGRSVLLANDGTGRFQDVTEAAGLGTAPQWSMAAAWADYDQDGWVDLFFANYGPDDPCRLLRNKGDGTFEDVTASVKLPALKFATGAAFGDYDDDGDPDLYLSVYTGPNHLFRNDRGVFTDVTFEAGVERPLASFAVWFFDYDNDGRLDLFCGTFWPVFEDSVRALVEPESSDPALTLRLYRNRGDGTFQDVTAEAGLDRVISTMGANFGDLDNDGWPDLYLGTGNASLAHLVPNRMFRNRGGRSFEDVTFAGGFGHLQKGHGVAFGDTDGDGDQDVLVNLGGAVPVDRFQPALFENPGNGAHWLQVQLVGGPSNRSAIGATLTATLPGGRRVHRRVASGGPFGAASLRQHLGLGEATSVERLEVRWPSGLVETRHGVAADQILVWKEGATGRAD